MIYHFYHLKDNIAGEELKGPLESIDAFISYRRVGGSQLARYCV